MIKQYYNLAKPGIIYGNLITAAAGFFLASRGPGHLALLLATLAGISFVIGSFCVFNNIIDTDIDLLMERTKSRAIVTGQIRKRTAALYGVILGIIGIVILGKFTNLLTLAVALAGGVIYLAAYTPLKRVSVHSTIFGSFAGAVPPVVGYVAVTNHLDAAAYILFAILVFWQMPHFYSIAIFRLKDYTDAHIPVMPVETGIAVTKKYIIGYIILFIIALISLWVLHYAGILYLSVALILSLYWLGLGLRGFNTSADAVWARRMFRFSLITLTMISLAMAIGAIIHI